MGLLNFSKGNWPLWTEIILKTLIWRSKLLRWSSYLNFHHLLNNSSWKYVTIVVHFLSPYYYTLHLPLNRHTRDSKQQQQIYDFCLTYLCFCLSDHDNDSLSCRYKSSIPTFMLSSRLKRDHVWIEFFTTVRGLCCIIPRVIVFCHYFNLIVLLKNCTYENLNLSWVKLRCAAF